MIANVGKISRNLEGIKFPQEKGGEHVYKPAEDIRHFLDHPCTQQKGKSFLLWCSVSLGDNRLEEPRMNGD